MPDPYYDLYRKDASPKEWGVAALAVGWFVDQMKDNAVSVRMGKDIFQFIKQPDGTFTAPPGSTMILTKATDGAPLGEIVTETVVDVPETPALSVATAMTL